MANKQLFTSYRGEMLPKTDTINDAGGKAYKLDPEHALTQYVITGCLSNTFYATAQTQLESIDSLVSRVSPEFIAQLAIYARQEGYMKDTPALLCAYLSSIDHPLFKQVFPQVVDNGRMLRTFVQIIRSGVTGRKSFGNLPKQLIRQKLEKASGKTLLNWSVGKNPSLRDIIRMVHPRPSTASRAALYGYLIGKEVNVNKLPEIVQEYEAFKAGVLPDAVPDINFQLLAGLPLSTEHWVEIAKEAPWHMARMNLNTFQRHGVFDYPGMTKLIADRLRDPESIKRAKVFPYQLLTAYLYAQSVPHEIQEALQDAMEIATENVPAIEGKVVICLDGSTSMTWPITGTGSGKASVIRNIDVASLITATILRKNPSAEVIIFNTRAWYMRLNPRDSVMTNARILLNECGGGTDCSAPLQELNRAKAEADTVIYVSDNESWFDTRMFTWIDSGATKTMQEWSAFKARNPQAKIVCIDITPKDNTQTVDRKDILNVGGFSDQVFNVVSNFISEKNSKFFVDIIKAIEV